MPDDRARDALDTTLAAPAPAPARSAAVARRRRQLDPFPSPPPFIARRPAMAALYMAAAVLIGLTQGLGLNFISANLNQISGSLGATTTETSWLIAAYFIPNASLTLLMMKFRAQFGLRRFAEGAIVVFVAVTSAHLLVDDLRTALVVRFFAGIAASPMSSLAFLYMLESFPPARKTTIGLCLALANISMALPMTRLVSPYLLDIGGWRAFYVAEIALAMISSAAIKLLPLNSPPRAKVIEPLDFVSYGFIATGLGSLAVFLSMGRLYWWFEALWLGGLLALAIAALTVAALIELHRENPILDVRWLSSRPVLHFAGTLLMFRFVLSEQSTGANGFFQNIGLLNEQMATLNAILVASSIAAGLACACVMKPGREPAIHAVALSMLIAGALMDAQATSLTRPEQMYLSQALIAAAAGLYLPPAVAIALTSALKKGPNYMLSFIIVFLTTQSMGGLLGSAAFGTFVTIREKFHSHQIVDRLVMSDPIVAQRVAQLGSSYGRVLIDPALRNGEGVTLLAAQASREAYVLAYDDAFMAIAAIAAFALAALVLHVLMRRIRVAIGGRDEPATA